ncbi:sensor domain-containing diguanylate cyclase [Paenibacillus turpanensis]|uniref:sensor domain-containing diguanylate cyclase n=1 Tax=Paenibacillus turpanensis TaxID=2689078 RepID=UPI00140C0BBA|nr:sensor domain-containing diguanylate cyclase [Paenibacillus turpanensis]
MISSNELQLYTNFEELANDVLQMASEFMKDKLIFLSAITQTQQLILKVLDNNSGSRITEGMELDIQGTVCQRIDFDNRMPLIYEDMSKESCLDDVRNVILDANVNSYVGVPIVQENGEVFGTLCAVHSLASTFDPKSVRMLQRISKMFSYYLALEQMAFRDALTGLYNRQYLSKHFSAEPSTSGAIFFLDLDGFKKVNDLYGHDKGDFVLKEASHRINSYVTKHNGFAVRLGGDEFIITVPEVMDSALLSTYAEEIISRLSAWEFPIKECDLSASIGIVTCHPEDRQDLNALLKKADQALYQAKAAGKRAYRFY